MIDIKDGHQIRVEKRKWRRDSMIYLLSIEWVNVVYYGEEIE